MLLPDRDNALEWKEPNEDRAVKRLKEEAIGKLVVCYEARPRCLVIAPSLVPMKPAERIKACGFCVKVCPEKAIRLVRAGS